MPSEAGKGGVRAVDLNMAPWIDHGAARLKEFKAYGKRLRLVEFLPGFSDPSWCVEGHVVGEADLREAGARLAASPLNGRRLGALR